MSKIFEDAIADAKKLREVAEENAKKAILEAVTPRIREFIEDQLLDDNTTEQEVETLEENMEDEVILDESSLTSLISMLGGETSFDALNESSAESLTASVRAAVNNLTDADKQKLLNLAEKVNLDASQLAENNQNIVTNQETKQMEKGEKFYEVDLRALQEAVNEDGHEMEEMAHMEEDAHEDVEEMEHMEEGEQLEETDHVEEGSDADLEALMQEIKLVLDLGEEIAAEDVPEALQGMVEEDDEDAEEVELADEEEAAPEAEEDPMDAEAPLDVELPEEPAAEEETLEEVFEIDPEMLRQELANVRKSIQETNSNTTETNTNELNEAKTQIRQLRRSNRAQTEKLNKYRSAVKTLREQLEDLNLFNAKLLYVNKLLQNKNLNESHKKSIIKALDEAQTLAETKALYKSLTESLSKSKKTTINESTRFGSSSRATTSAASKESQVGSEFSHWQKLAGIK